jgi:hypothetical protein
MHPLRSRRTLEEKAGYNKTVSPFDKLKAPSLSRGRFELSPNTSSGSEGAFRFGPPCGIAGEQRVQYPG